ncbi:hypothetical protein EMQ_1115 [Acetobacter aceti NBRC 14818]|uniref:Uncharacterized protein n=1 Tax=Acetobacter aceti NBRC 14818 TaxID=887700 RepID=A0AB33ID48_ACEAC|nr:hypothetical protein EMQ_1115 [Acetobacter aceti NBRC 14818]GAN58762.1 hypothetical protein Abac_063_097 [Acetobacter aceti NBRC 14818]
MDIQAVIECLGNIIILEGITGSLNTAIISGQIGIFQCLIHLFRERTNAISIFIGEQVVISFGVLFGMENLQGMDDGRVRDTGP